MHYEIFHPFSAYVNNQIRAYLLQKFSLDDEALKKLGKKNKRKLLKLLRDAREAFGDKQIMYKVFPNLRQISMSELERLIIRRRGVAVALIVRNPLRIQLSFAKAKMLDSYVNVDTTDLKVELNAREVIEFAKEMGQMFQETARCCRKHSTPYVYVSYESLYESGGDALPAQIMVERLNEIVTPPIELSKDPEVPQFKQDKSSVSDSIKNYEEFAAQLSQEGFGALLEDSTAYQEAIGIMEAGESC